MIHVLATNLLILLFTFCCNILLILFSIPSWERFRIQLEKRGEVVRIYFIMKQTCTAHEVELSSFFPSMRPRKIHSICRKMIHSTSLYICGFDFSRVLTFPYNLLLCFLAPWFNVTDPILIPMTKYEYRPWLCQSQFIMIDPS